MELGKLLKKIKLVKNLFFILLVLPLISFGQKKFDTEIESNSRPGLFYYLTWKTSNKPKSRKYDRLIFDIYYSGAYSADNISNNSSLNLGFSSNFMNEFALNKNNTISIGTGLGLSTTKINLNYNLVLGNDNFISCFPSESYDYQKNSLNGLNFNIPLELRFKTKGWSHYKIHFGGRLGYQVRLKENYFYDDTDRNYKTSLKKAAEHLTYSIHTRIGIRNYSIYASYNLNPLFKHVESPKLNWFQLGLSISLF